MKAASTEDIPLPFLLRNGVQVPQQSGAPAVAQTIAQFTDSHTQRAGYRSRKMSDNPTGSFKAERTIPGVSGQRQLQVRRLNFGHYLRCNLIHSIIGRK
jgi:hypothetical protein